MKICFLNSLYYERERGGGVYTYLHNIPQALAKKGHKVTVLTAGPPSQRKEHDVHIVSIHQVLLYTHTKSLFSFLFLFSRIMYMIKATRYLLKENFDIIEVADGGFEHLFLVFFTKTPIITRMHGRTADTKKVRFPKLFCFFENIPIRKSTGTSFPSKSYYTYFVKKYGHICPNPMVIPYSITTPSIQKKVRAHDKKNILTVGLLSKRKGIDILLKVAEKCLLDTQINFVLAGANLENMDTALFPPNIDYIGYKNRKELSSYFASCDIFLSTSRFETFGIAIAEALSYGKPVIVNDSVGTNDFVKDGINGFIFKKDNTNDAYLKINQILTNKSLQNKLSLGARKTVVPFSLKKVVSLTENYYAEITQ